MPNLMPDWMDWIQPAGRLLWSLFLSGVSVAFVVALLLPPVAKRSVSTPKALIGFPIIAAIFILLARFVDSLQTIWIWCGILGLIGYALSLVISRTPHDPAKPYTWVDNFLGATAVFAILWLVYAVVPHEWLTFANSYLEWGDNTKFVWQSGDQIVFGLTAPFDFNMPALRDIVVTGIYIFVLGANVFLWVKWQKRFAVKATPEPSGALAKLSRFGRPLRKPAPAEPVPAATAAAGEA
jgi:hypothetical protein